MTIATQQRYIVRLKFRDREVGRWILDQQSLSIGRTPANDIVINNLMDHTYYAVIRVRQGEELIEIDSRPSDAIALAVHYSPTLPIFVEEGVLEEVA